MKDAFIKVKTKKQYIEVLSLAKLHGYTIVDHNDPQKYAYANYSNYSCINIGSDRKRVIGINPYNGNMYSHCIQINYPQDAADLISFFVSPSREYILDIELAGHKISVGEDGIQAGCQTIKFEDFEKLVNLVNQYKDDNK